MAPTDSIDRFLIDRRQYVKLGGALAAGLTAGLAGCTGDDESSGDDGSPDGAESSATGLLSTAVSDQPGDIGDFESCIVTLDGIWVGPMVGEEDDEDSEEAADGDETEDDADDGTDQQESERSSEDSADGSQPGDDSEGEGSDDEDADDPNDEEDGQADGEDGADEEDTAEDDGDEEDADEDDSDDDGRTYYEFDEPQEADLVELQGESSQLVGEHELEVGTYQFLQLDVADVEGTLTDGGEAVVDTPGNAPLQFQESFDVREGYRTTFLADFTPHRRGNGEYLFRPVASETEVSYEEIEDSDGSEEDGDAGDEDGSTDDGGSDGSGGNESA